MQLREIGQDILFAGYVAVLFLIIRAFLKIEHSTQAARQFLENISW